MSKEFDLYEKDELTFKTKLFYLMDLLVSNKFLADSECILLIFLSYFQIVAGFYSDDVKIFTKSGEGPDPFFTNIQSILRVKDLFYNNYSIFELIIIFIFIIIISQVIVFFYSIKYMNRYANYSFREKFLNYTFKYFHYLLLTPILDLSFSVFCFSDSNPNFANKSCSLSETPYVSVFSILIFLYAIFLAIFLSIYYNDSFFLSNSSLARTNCNYELYHNINVIVYSILLSLVKYIGKEVFMIYNLAFSIFSTRYYMNNYPYFNNIISFITGCYQYMYTWTSFFILYLSIFSVKQMSLIYIIGSLIVIWMFKNIKFKFEEKIILDTPFNKITNKSHILFYVNAILKKIQNMDQNDEDKAEMIGVIQMHITECPLSDCASKKKERIYLPLVEEWTNRQILEINDKIYLINFITFIFNFYISQNYMSADLYMNLAIYYLQTVGNYFLSAFYFKKVNEYKLNDQENFSYFRLKKLIQKSLLDKLKPTNEPCNNMQDLNTTMYFKYDDMGQKFFDEITSDCNSNLEFWKIFKGFKEKNDKLDFNKIFILADRIRISKNKIESYWDKLFNIYNGFNDMFDLYENYIYFINDDGVLFRELEIIKNKILLSTENSQNNFTQILFSKETGILIANGDKGKEGQIEHVNEQIEAIFDYRGDELKGININHLMPKIFSKVHHQFMEQYNKIGEKRIINKQFCSYGKDRNNNLVPLTLRTKNFPILSDYILYISLISKQNLDDVILLDNKFNIQGMSQRLMERLELNESIFQDCDIPFYLICRKFIDHYKKNTKEDKHDKLYRNISKIEKEMNMNSNNFNANIGNNSNVNNNEEKLNDEFLNLEIHENAELEFEIKIPPLLHNYSATNSHRRNYNNLNEMNDNGSSQNDDTNLDIIQEEEDNKIEESVMGNQESEENVNLVSNKTGRRNSYIIQNNALANNNNINNFANNNSNSYKENATYTYTNTETAENYNNNYDMNYVAAERRQSTKNAATKFEDQEIQYRINYLKNLFEKRAFENLDYEMERIFLDCRTEEYKFIFSFENYKFSSENYNGFVVRCIERQFEDIISYSDGSRQKELLKTGPLRQYTSHLFQNRKAKNSHLYKYLKDFIELTKEDITDHKSLQVEILKKYFEEFIDNKMINESRQEMLKVSKFFSPTEEELDKTDDAASSHSSQSDGQEEFSKKSRIMEIRSNLTKDIDKFYTLQAIKTIFLIMVILSVVFSAVFIFNFTEIVNDVINVHHFSNLLTRSIFIFSEIISNLISLKSLYTVFLNNRNNTNILNQVTFNSYIADKFFYFDSLKNESKIKYSNLTTYFSEIESLMQKYLQSQSNYLYWTKVENIHLYSYMISGNQYTEIPSLYTSLGISLLEILSNYNEIIQAPAFDLNIFNEIENFKFKNNKNANIPLNNNFTNVTNANDQMKNINVNQIIGTNSTKLLRILNSVESNNFNDDIFELSHINQVFSLNDLKALASNINIDQEFINQFDYRIKKMDYSSYISIQGAYFVAIPQLLDINSQINDYLVQINDNNLREILILFITFSSVFIFLSFLFIVFLCLTNSNMQQGLEKISLIPADKINDTIKKIMEFREKILDKFVKMDLLFSGKNLEKEKSIGKKILEKRKKKEQEITDKLNENKYAFDENRKIKNLKILNSSYYLASFIVGILAAILIPVFYQCKTLIDNSNEILFYKRYIIKDLISTNLNILNIKCKIFSCEKSQFFNRNYKKDFSLNYNFSFIYEADADEKMNLITNTFSDIYNFYENKYMLDICFTISDVSEIYFKLNTEDKKLQIINSCKKDNIIVASNQTNSLIKIIKDSIFNLEKNINLQPTDYSNAVQFTNENFRVIEYIYYNYLNKIYPNFEYYIESAINGFSSNIEIFILIFMILFCLLIFIFAIYIYFFYINTLINLLAISRCVLRVIPTNVIFETPKLEAWIESKF